MIEIIKDQPLRYFVSVLVDGSAPVQEKELAQVVGGKEKFLNEDERKFGLRWWEKVFGFSCWL